jgi:CRISPR-associated endonuclease/helicase Cas3
MALAGLVSVADWIGSNTDFFPHLAVVSAPPLSLELNDYLKTASVSAARALTELGWTGWNPDASPRQFSDLFPAIPAPNPLQLAIERLRAGIREPGLVIIEAPMGEGKTEAALALADSWGSILGQRGVYFALPTMATSNQMFGRLKEFLTTRYPDQQVNMQLLHGHAALSAELEELREADRLRRGLFMPRGIYDDAEAGTSGAILAAEWFTHRKRGLLAPFGVGTVDQALLAVLRTRHGFVRIFGLAYKTVIVDEVHAYDAYMLSLLDRLLEWMGALGCSVVLLSATLPCQRRDALVAAYRRGRGDATATDRAAVAYPRTTATSGADVRVLPISTSDRSRKRLTIGWESPDIPGVPESQDGLPDFPLGQRLRDALAGGGCAAVICNTVGRAQRMFRALRPFFAGVAADGGPEIDLLHAQFPFGRRQARESRSLARFGKPGSGIRPSRAVLVATQVIEQSLDLDFDLLVSDLAPIDLLLQRSGRLHRHERARPTSVSHAALWVLGGTEATGGPQYPGGATAVYDEHVLLRTWIELNPIIDARGQLRVPEDVERLIEAVYDDDRGVPSGLAPSLAAQWNTTRTALFRRREQYRAEAERRDILPPFESDGVFEQYNPELSDEDDPSVHQTLQALTRLGDPSIGVVLLGPNDAGFEGPGAPSIADTRRLLDASLSVSHRGLVPALVQQPIPTGWRRSPLLRNLRLVRLGAAGEAVIAGARPYRLRLDPDVGLEISPIR